MLASSGESGPPCGVASSLGSKGSPTRLATRAIRMSCWTLSKNFAKARIDGDAVARPDISLYLPERSMGRTIGPEAETRFRELRIEDRRQDLRDGLLDQPINHGRYSQRPPAPARLRDHHPTPRLRAVAAIDKALANRRPLLAREFGEVLNGHAVDTRRTPVGLHPHPRAAQVLRREHLLHQSNMQGWLRDPTQDRKSTRLNSSHG